jgi:hypothetical protein
MIIVFVMVFVLPACSPCPPPSKGGQQLQPAKLSAKIPVSFAGTQRKTKTHAKADA